MPTAQVTITAKTGPAVQDTAIVLTGVTQINFGVSPQVVQLTVNGLIKEYDLAAVTTITVSLTAAGNWTVVIS